MASLDARSGMVELQLRARGIGDERVLAAFRDVPREAFVPEDMAEFAYEDSPLPIGYEQTISQPYIVAVTAEALALRGVERVLEVGTGSGYAAAILSRLGAEVVTLERLPELAEPARERLARLGYDNVEVIRTDGTLGWPEQAPYDAIAVAASGPDVPRALLEQLAVGGRLVIPVGAADEQELVRVTRTGDHEYTREALSEVTFVPLIGAQGWAEPARPAPGASPGRDAAELVREAAEPIVELDGVPLGPLLERIDGARLVLLGESTHGTSEFYRMRARISLELIERLGFDFVAVEADWPDAARVDAYVIGSDARPRPSFLPFARFPSWMWRNDEVRSFVERLRANNRLKPAAKRAGFHGLDLYSLFTSIAAVLDYLEGVDPEAVPAARARYGTLTPWQADPAAYGRAVLAGHYQSSEQAVVGMLRELLEKRFAYAEKGSARFFDATANARLVASAEAYYRTMYYGSARAWNLRDSHMFDTLKSLLAFYGPDSRGIVWEHNSHVGNARATEMSARGEHNLGELCRREFGDAVFAIGFGTDHGTVAAAHDWDEPLEIMPVRPARADSYEHCFHQTALPSFLLPFKGPRAAAVRDALSAPRLERAIGVIYRPETERASHYFHAILPWQFDEFVWFDETHAVTPLSPIPAAQRELPETYPFGL